eukprot:gnl/MRDRNA2_/MRDRNA2_90228_c0_seq1.p1 gnl/MRDRNA2_/MRDRNA2_90228_c0~~gnl/MRDRNA2_/MRDRNA2_90228_c0_seq1.p1  ORF type:complete len:805 (+),score=175.76 gnl/MRDRNA2_/MRDRNA2_90228_c0_seq1:75-2489(+)
MAGSDVAIRLRLNVSALMGEGVVGKFLVVIDAEAGMEQLMEKIQKTLQRGGITATIERILNSLKATLPSDELVGDMLRDGEEVFVMLRGDAGAMLGGGGGGQSSSSRAGPSAASQSTSAPGPSEMMMGGGGGSDSDSDEDGDRHAGQPQEVDYPPPPVIPRGAQPGTAPIQGPQETFQGELMPLEAMQANHPVDPIEPTSYDNDWLVENMAPKLREYVLNHFQESLISEAKYVASIGKYVGARFYQKSGSFVSVFMRPQTAIGSDPNATMPVHYNVARVDIVSFQKDVEGQIERIQQHLELLAATMRGLKALLSKGMSESDHINVMLPYSYKTFDEVEGLMLEAERPLFTSMQASRPIIVVDTSGGLGKHLIYIKAALKRTLYAHMASKQAIQLIKFSPAQGSARAWAQEMVPPTEQALQAAETWIDGLTASSTGNILDAVRLAIAHQDADGIFLISSGDVDKVQHDGILTGVRALNVREIAIHTIGVEAQPRGELLLRNIAESNHGDFSLKSFEFGKEKQQSTVCSADVKWTSWRTQLINEKSKQMSEDFKKQRLSIGGQIKIIDVMIREEARKEGSWKEEWKCAQRLLLASETQGAIPDKDQVRELERKTTRSLSVRVGGGFIFQTDEQDLGMENLFEHRSMVPWTANSDTIAMGPKLAPNAMSLQPEGRTAKFPPSADVLPESTLPPPERRRRPRSARPPGTGQRKPRARSPAQGNPWAGAGAMDRTRRPPKPSGSNARLASGDRAAGGSRPRSPSQSKRTPRQASTGRMPPMSSGGSGGGAYAPQVQSLPDVTMERRWSF